MSNPARTVANAIAPSTTLSRYGEVVAPALPPNYVARYIVADLVAALHDAEEITLDTNDATPAFRRLYTYLVERYGETAFLSAWASDVPGRER